MDIVSRRLAPCAAAVAMLLFAGNTAAAQIPDEGAFVILVGATDTFAIENFSRSPDRLTGDITGRSIGRLAYSASLADDGVVRQLTLDYYAPGASTDAAPAQAATVSTEGDSVRLAITVPEGVPDQIFESVPNAFIYLNPSLLLVEQIVRHARTVGADTYDFPAFVAQGEGTFRARVSNSTSDQPVVSIGPMIHTVVDPDGRLASASIPQQGLTIHRVDHHLPSLSFDTDASDSPRIRQHVAAAAHSLFAVLAGTRFAWQSEGR